jgi:hypothetical protein
VPRSCLLNFHELGWQLKQLAHLDLPFAEEEVKNVIMNAPKEKVHGPDGFIGIFFSHCWDIIKANFLRAIDRFWMVNQQGLHFLNQALVALIHKINNP